MNGFRGRAAPVDRACFAHVQAHPSSAYPRPCSAATPLFRSAVVLAPLRTEAPPAAGRPLLGPRSAARHPRPFSGQSAPVTLNRPPTGRPPVPRRPSRPPTPPASTAATPRTPAWVEVGKTRTRWPVRTYSRVVPKASGRVLVVDDNKVIRQLIRSISSWRLRGRDRRPMVPSVLMSSIRCGPTPSRWTWSCLGWTGCGPLPAACRSAYAGASDRHRQRLYAVRDRRRVRCRGRRLPVQALRARRAGHARSAVGRAEGAWGWARRGAGRARCGGEGESPARAEPAG